jgi:hypothetical protein
MTSPAPLPPDPHDVVVDPAGLEALGAELSTLAADLREDGDLSRTVSADLRLALAGRDGWSPAAGATAWASLLELLADRTDALARTLDEAAAAYRAQDAALTAGMAAGNARVPR